MLTALIEHVEITGYQSPVFIHPLFILYSFGVAEG